MAVFLLEGLHVVLGNHHVALVVATDHELVVLGPLHHAHTAGVHLDQNFVFEGDTAPEEELARVAADYRALAVVSPLH